MLRLMLRQCDGLLAAAEGTHVDKVEKLKIHKGLLHQKLIKALESAGQAFKKAEQTAKIPRCVQCRRKQGPTTIPGAERTRRPLER